MKGTALALFLVLLVVVVLIAVSPTPGLAQVRGGFYGGGHYGGYWGGRYYGGFYGGPFWSPFWWPYYAAPLYYGAYGPYGPYPYYAYSAAPQYVAPPTAPATKCYAPRVDQSGKVVMMPDYSRPVPCPPTQ